MQSRATQTLTYEGREQCQIANDSHLVPGHLKNT